ncbi:MAG TPA: DUF3782 domain-containing protein [Anaerolineae bacterium]|nr:DUF3782 domain-containing protein [Anaerolineae bacterium]
MATITKEELPEIVREELFHLLRDVPAVRYQLVGMMVETFARRTDLQAILERIDAQREDFNQRMEEFAERQEEHSRRLEEHSRRMDELREDFNRRFAEHSRRLDEMREDFNRGFAQHSREIRDVDLHVQALGARWGILAEDAFRAGIAGILIEETGLKAERYLKMDTEGQVFGRPAPVEIDVVIHDGDCWLLGLKSSISRGDVSLFQRKVAFYEREEGAEVKRMILISPYFDPGAEELARDLGMETYTSAHEVRM